MNENCEQWAMHKPSVDKNRSDIPKDKTHNGFWMQNESP